MSIDDEIKIIREAYANRSDEELIKATHQWGPQSANHIAATMVLRERQRTDNDIKHAELIDRAAGANKWAKRACVLTAISCILALISLLFKK